MFFSYISKIVPYVTRVITGIFLSAAFVLGIGITAILVKIFGGVSLDNENTKSSWKQITGGKKMERMF